jgi:hypothetical protein
VGQHHGSYDAVAPPHDWWDWYAAYMDARERGSTPEEASAAAERYMEQVKHVGVSPLDVPTGRWTGDAALARGVSSSAAGGPVDDTFTTCIWALRHPRRTEPAGALLLSPRCDRLGDARETPARDEHRPCG